MKWNEKYSSEPRNEGWGIGDYLALAVSGALLVWGVASVGETLDNAIFDFNEWLYYGDGSK